LADVAVANPAVARPDARRGPIVEPLELRIDLLPRRPRCPPVKVVDVRKDRGARGVDRHRALDVKPVRPPLDEHREHHDDRQNDEQDCSHLGLAFVVDYFFLASSFSSSRARSTASLEGKSSSSKSWRISISASAPSPCGGGTRLPHSIASSRDFTWISQ